MEIKERALPPNGNTAQEVSHGGESGSQSQKADLEIFQRLRLYSKGKNGRLGRIFRIFVSGPG
jgi:hypothetical protein